jgi:hypothetical protein
MVEDCQAASRRKESRADHCLNDSDEGDRTKNYREKCDDVPQAVAILPYVPPNGYERQEPEVEVHRRYRKSPINDS